MRARQTMGLCVRDRWIQVNKLKLCNNCLCTVHLRKNCRMFGCKICKQKHRSLLHEQRKTITVTESMVSNDNVEEPSLSINSLCLDSHPIRIMYC